ncbi:hypothetical protein ACQPZF_16680 [Actinosynnema sp. CS-041913]|uniref:hypothetical protein n=1 Tax=Actinosynnema sp. CS-041913 TaxID=3239917 RepID=UPI003D8B89CE
MERAAFGEVHDGRTLGRLQRRLSVQQGAEAVVETASAGALGDGGQQFRHVECAPEPARCEWRQPVQAQGARDAAVGEFQHGQLAVDPPAHHTLSEIAQVVADQHRSRRRAPDLLGDVVPRQAGHQ